MTDLLILTRPGSFQSLGEQIQRAFPGRSAVTDWQQVAETQAGVVIVLWWHAAARGVLDKLRIERGTIGAVFDSISWVQPHAREALRRCLPRFDVLVVGNEQILRDLRSAYGTLPPVCICETGADLERFSPAPLPAAFRLGWCGNSMATGTDDKGLSIVREAADLAGVPLEIADLTERQGPRVDHADMPAWFRGISCLAIGSTSEGTPRPLLEALATGRPVVSTRVGVVSRLVHHGINGVIVNRSASSIATGIRYMQETLASHPLEVQSAARQAAVAWSDSHMIAKWAEAVHLLDTGPWWRKGKQPAANSVARPQMAREYIAGLEMRGESAPRIALQRLVDEVEAEKGRQPGRPLILVASEYRFASRTLHLIDAMVSRYRFVVGASDERPSAIWGFYPFGGVTATRGAWPGVPVLLTMRGRFWQYRPELVSMGMNNYSKASFITTLTNSLHRELVEHCPAVAGIPHRTVHNGNFIAEVDAVAGGDRSPSILTITNFCCPGKKQAVEEFAAALNSEGFTGEYLIASLPFGDPPRLPACARYLGHRADRLSLLHTASVFVYPAAWDGQPTSLIEAMSAGLPCVVGRASTSGAQEFVEHGRTGLLFDTPLEGAQLAMRLLHDHDRAWEMGRAARVAMETDYSWDRAADAYCEILSGLIRPAKSA